MTKTSQLKRSHTMAFAAEIHKITNFQILRLLRTLVLRVPLRMYEPNELPPNHHVHPRKRVMAF